MAALREEFEAFGCTEVRTYIQSGNVVFDMPGRSPAEADLESALEARFGFAIPVVLRTRAQFRSIVHDAPSGFGQSPDTYHSDVAVLKAPLTSAQAMRAVGVRDGVDEVWPGKGVVYFQRLSARRTESRMSKIAGTPEYRSMTIRNWNTVTTLRTMLDA
ncbi:MAG: hypothetical protein RL238_1355 [Actinomycetota bacterium]|jgi:uncharacterized protein (DUF1697 family)